jgi:gamma-glutamyltranspeptidase / glutathione hydrolase
VSAAVSAPRLHAQWMPNAVVVEPDIPRDVIEALEKRGHKVVPAASLATVQAVGVSPTRLTAACDPRYGGAPAAP